MKPHAIAASLVVCAIATSQSQASVLDLQRSFHIGVYSATIAAPGGAVSLFMQVGGMDLTPAGALSGLFDSWEMTAGGTVFTPNDPFAGTYVVRPDGNAVFDLDPSHPGTNLVGLWIAPDGSLVHTARANQDPEAISVLAVAKSSGKTLASLNGTYRYSGQFLHLVGGALQTTSSWGVVTFDGIGGYTASGTEMHATAAGTTTSPNANTGTYTVAPDGAVTIGGDRGGVSDDGQLVFGMFASPGGAELGITIAVKVGQSYDLHDLTGRYGLHGQGYTLGTGPALPRSTTRFGEFGFAATSTTLGTWTTNGVLAEGTPLGATLSPWSPSGLATLSSTGTLQLTASANAMTFDVSANGRYLVGRELGNNTNLLFASRQCAVAVAYGVGTAGTGGQVPSLGMKTFPMLGNSNWSLRIANGIGGGIGVLPIGFAAAPGIPALGGTIFLDPTAVGFIPLVVLNGALGVPGAGQALTTLALPTTPSLAGIQLFAQGLILDNAAPAGFSMSNAFRAELSR